MIPHLQPVYAIKWRKSKNMLEAYIDRYNAGKPLGEQLRSGHKKLAEYLLYLYERALAYEQAFGEVLTEGEKLPMLRTNNRQLCDELGCTDRTIINLRARLKAAGVIKREIFHGTNAQYEVELSAQVVHLQNKGNPNNAIHRFLPGFHPSQQCEHGVLPHTCTLCMAKTFRHTVSSTIPDTRELIKLSGAHFQPGADSQTVTPLLAVGDGEKPVENRENRVENPHRGNEQVTKPELRTGYETAAKPDKNSPPVAAAPPAGELDTKQPPEFAPDTLAQALAGLSQAAADSIRRHLAVIWTCASLNLYADKWISDEEAERGRARLAEYFLYAHPDGWTGGAAEILERIILVQKWIERGRKEDKKRWVPLPSDYFDIRNGTGFRATKKWYKGHIKSKSEIKAQELLTKAHKEYLKSWEPGAVRGPTEAYRRISQRLGKYDRALLERFHQLIMEDATRTTTSQAQGQ